MTFAELANRVKMTVDTTGFKFPVNITKLLQEAENEFIRKTLCTEYQTDFQIKASTVEFDGTETNIAFVAGSGSTRDTITDSDSGFVTDGFAEGQELVVDGSTSNDGTYTIYSVATGTITLNTIGALTSEDGVADMTMAASEIPYKRALPSDFVTEHRVEYRGIKLILVSQREIERVSESTNLRSTGTPSAYWLQDDFIHLFPKPIAEGTLKLWYTFYNTDSTTTSPIIPTIDQDKLVNQVIGTLYEITKEIQLADRYLAKFENDCRKTALKYMNQRHKQTRIVDVVSGGINRYHLENRIGTVTE
ncbi:MAG: hypothetical protein ABIH42_09165 [Planctomycetota bacterium]